MHEFRKSCFDNLSPDLREKVLEGTREQALKLLDPALQATIRSQDKTQNIIDSILNRENYANGGSVGAFNTSVDSTLPELDQNRQDTTAESNYLQKTYGK